MDIADPEVVRKNNATDAPQETPELGSDRYRIHSTLGAGGMGIVYLAEDLKLHRQVAIKKLREDVATQNARERIQQEARLLAQLNHPNIVALHDVLEETAGSDTSVALVMEYIEGTTLRAWMRERSPSLQQKLSLLMQICLGLQQAHELGIIHRDLKADNILIAENAKGEPVAKITDFGIAKSQQLDEKTLTAENQLAGTITAMSPEQILGKTLTARSDLFSLGAIAFELLCGSRPFEKHEGGALAMANRITSEPHIPPQQAWAGIPEPLSVLLDKLLAKEPTQRPESAQIVYQGFTLLHKQGMESDAEDFTATLTDLFTQQKVKSRRRWQRVVAGVAATLVLGAGSYWGWKEITRLEPQYIAVMPVEINGEIRGEENAKALTKTMVRQALMSSVSQLKASELVNFEPNEKMDLDAKFQKLRDKGVTDTLFARLNCLEERCEIAIQRIDPTGEIINSQTQFKFIHNLRQESQHLIENRTIAIFPKSYKPTSIDATLMNDVDYQQYLDIAIRADSNEATEKDLEQLEKLSANYSKNVNLHRVHAKISKNLFIESGKAFYLQRAITNISNARKKLPDLSTLIGIELSLRSYDNHSEEFENLTTLAKDSGHPTSEIAAQHARYLHGKRKYQLGIKYALEAVKLNPSADNFYQLSRHQVSLGNYSSAIKNLHDIIDRHPSHWSSLALLGGIYLEQGDFASAEQEISKIPVTERTWRTTSNLANAYFLQKKYEEALESSREVLILVPNDNPTKGLIAETLIMLNRIDDAKEVYNDLYIATQDSTDLESLIYKALSLANLGRNSEALAIIHTLIVEAPEDTYIKYAASQVYSLAGEFRSADLFAQQLVNQGMGADWFQLPAFQSLCSQESTSEKVKDTFCI
ncbi:protein kinase [Microbulbifer agarilyticus]|uniref:serine/threonine-protein kinase n=1 Tax=Microbulbifer agarilyticus TaxID=260552 RepID=UPI001C960EB3|nr:serine/threonine-protein kinase [Microbulbifer agarilyticus]MBY6210315.1 protein kinase [Microbulbifer agarilyticus]